MDKLYPIIRRKRRPLIQENAETLKPEILKQDRLPPVAVVPLLAAVPDVPSANPAKTCHAKSISSNAAS
jgi:hypothetical protein